MKRIFTLLLGAFITLASFAADRRPTVNVQNHSYFKVLVDGRAIYDNASAYNFFEVGYGRHTITLVEERGGFFGRRARVISSSDFRVDGDDRRIMVDVDRLGRVRISKSEFGDGGWGRDNDRYDRDRRDNHDRDNDRDHGGNHDRGGNRDWSNRGY